MEQTKRFAAALEPFDLLLTGYWALLLALHLVFSVQIAQAGRNVLAQVLAADLLFLVLIPAVAWATSELDLKSRTIIRVPVMYVSGYVGFVMGGTYIPLVNPFLMEKALVSFDIALFGEPVAAFLEGIAWAPLTDFLQVCYATHYVAALVLFILLFKNGKVREARYLLTATAAVFVSRLLFYVLVPARSPYVVAALPGMDGLILFDAPLPGSAITYTIRDFLHAAEANKFDCFPSGHTELSVVLLIAVWRYHRKAFPPFLVVLSGLIFGTLYLRYHYVIDLAVGALLAWLIMWYLPKGDGDKSGPSGRFVEGGS